MSSSTDFVTRTIDTSAPAFDFAPLHHAPGNDLPLPGASPKVAIARTPPLYALAKRVTDVVLAALGLTLLLPLWVLVAGLILVTSPGPAIFRQTRVGRGGNLFWCYKFRTMVHDAEQWLKNDQEFARHFYQNWKLSDDPRLTRFGRWLRRTSLDEIPQLVNVLKGEMSLVGPRPVQIAEFQQIYEGNADQAFSVLPGVTGLWQVSGRSNLRNLDRVALDLLYVEKRNFWFDIKIMLQTIPAILSRRGAR